MDRKKDLIKHLDELVEKRRDKNLRRVAEKRMLEMDLIEKQAPTVKVNLDDMKYYVTQAKEWMRFIGCQNFLVNFFYNGNK